MTNQAIKVLELRNYLLTPDSEDAFNDYFSEHFVGPMAALHGHTLGQYRIKDIKNRFFWLRGFYDMHTRAKFLTSFYVESTTWKTFGPEANQMILDSDHVHLLRPLNQARSSYEPITAISKTDFLVRNGLVVINYYAARDQHLDQLIDLFQTAYLPFIHSVGIDDVSLWISEITENDFPRLPVIQDKNLLVAITAYDDEADFQLKQTRLTSMSDELSHRLQNLIAGMETLIVLPFATTR